MKGSTGNTGLVALSLAALALIVVVATDQVMRHRTAPAAPARTAVPAADRDLPVDEVPAPADSLRLTPSDEAMPPPGETLTI